MLFWMRACLGEVRAAFTSLHVFGDGLSTTTNGPGGSYYYGNRFSNGRIWVEVLAERQGLVFDSAKNQSYFGHYSPNLVTNVSNFVAPADVNTALFAIWVDNADFVSHLADPRFAPYNASNLPIWTNAIARSLSNHWVAIQTLYSKGARTLVMPTAVDVTQVPYYVGLPAVDKAFLRLRVIDFNVGFSNTLAQARASFPGLAIHMPNLFVLFDNVLARPADYGLVNALENGRSIDALSDFSLTDKSLTGPGASYIFWDYLDPTARAHAIIADVTQQLLSPPRISSVELVNGSCELGLTNVPLGLDGFADGGSNLLEWAAAATIRSTNSTQTISTPASAAIRFYRLRFPHAWTWP